MINGKKVTVVLPAYNAEKTLRDTYREIPKEFIDDILLVDDCSNDQTLKTAEELNLPVYKHAMNLGYGGNQKTCYREALARKTDVIVMLHPDYQYDSRLIPAMVTPICYGVYDVMLGSRIIGGQALKGGMPLYKYISNRFITFFQNLAYGKKISEYHTGYRAYRREVLLSIPFETNSNDFIFDAQILTQIIEKKFSIGELSCPTKYFPEASSINFWRSLKYGLGCLCLALQYCFRKHR